MKRKLIFWIGVVSLLFASDSFAREAKKLFHKGIWTMQGGIGFVVPGFYGDVTFPPINVAIERAIDDDWGIGLFLGYGASKETSREYFFGIPVEAEINYSYLIIGGSASLHADVGRNLDAYGRIFVGYLAASSSVSVSVPGYEAQVSVGGSTFGYGVYGGIVYYLSPSFGINAELGYGNVAVVRVGIGLKF